MSRDEYFRIVTLGLMINRLGTPDNKKNPPKDQTDNQK
jgi:hypothetical protein